jgi:hypothetical protein
MIVIIGSGPSAIQLAMRLGANAYDYVILDKGPLVRDHDDHEGAAKGFGGAALFSDGKFPKKPAGTAVWQLLDKQALDYAYNDCKDRITEANLEWGAETETTTASEESAAWSLKHYDCIYVPLETRMKWIDDARAFLKPHVRENCVVFEVQRTADGYAVLYQKNGDFVTVHRIECTHVVFATGRFALSFIDHPFPTRYLRSEVGVRIQCEATHPCWTELPETDTKFILKRGLKEWRTFCQIENGEVVQTRFSGVRTHSGRADVPSTGLSNIGFNFRNRDPNADVTIGAPFNVSYEEFKHMEQYRDIQEGLESFFEAKPLFDPSVIRVIGPTMEGVGWYPVLDANLKIPQEKVWCIGDCTGIFRGWTPADVSGTYVAKKIMEGRTQRVMHKVRDDAQYMLTCPRMTGEGSPALHEIHIFLLPLNPDPSVVAEFEACVDEWNAKHPDAKKPMKACVLALDFKDAGFVHVMQSSRYLPSNDQEFVVKECHADAQFFTERGFNVVREKIEASADGIIGIPRTHAEAAKWNKYFEFHIRVGTHEGVVTPEEELFLHETSHALTKELGVPVPLSYNAGKGQQRYLNLRVRSGLDEAEIQLAMVVDAIKQKMTVVKKIREYVWYDSYTALDKGWIDF